MEWIVEAESLSDFIDHGRYTLSTKPLIRCQDCKYYIPYEWMFDGLTRSSNRNDYSPDEIGCSVNDHNYPPDGFCSFGDMREDHDG